MKPLYKYYKIVRSGNGLNHRAGESKITRIKPSDFNLSTGDKVFIGFATNIKSARFLNANQWFRAANLEL